MSFRGLLMSLAMLTGVAAAQSLNCDLQGYKTTDGLKATSSGGVVTMTWQGEGAQELRASFGIRDGQPFIQELAARTGSGKWIVLGKDLYCTPKVRHGFGRKIGDTQRS